MLRKEQIRRPAIQMRHHLHGSQIAKHGRRDLLGKGTQLLGSFPKAEEVEPQGGAAEGCFAGAARASCAARRASGAGGGATANSY